MSLYLAFIAGLAVGFVGHCVWCCLQAEPDQPPQRLIHSPVEIWPPDARLALMRGERDEHEELTR